MGGERGVGVESLREIMYELFKRRNFQPCSDSIVSDVPERIGSV